MDAPLNQTRMQMLGELAEMGLVLARDLQQAALVATDMDEKVRLAGAFHRIGRGVRQSLALHARLERDAERARREDEAELISLEHARSLRRRSHLKGAVERLIWTEYEPDDTEGLDLADRLDALLDAEAETEDFLAADPDRLIAELCQVLGLPSRAVPDRPAQDRPRDGEVMDDAAMDDAAMDEPFRSSA